MRSKGEGLLVISCNGRVRYPRISSGNLSTISADDGFRAHIAMLLCNFLLKYSECSPFLPSDLTVFMALVHDILKQTNSIANNNEDFHETKMSVMFITVLCNSVRFMLAPAS